MDTSALNLTRTQFDEHLRQALEHARQAGHREWFAKSLVIPPVALIDAFSKYQGFGWFLSQPDGVSQLGLGLVRDWQWNDGDGLERMEKHAQRLTDGLPPEVLLVGGTGFSPASQWDGWPGVYLALPMAQVIQTPDGTLLTVTLWLDGEQQQPVEMYLRRLEPIWRALSSQIGHSGPAQTPTLIQSRPSRQEWMARIAEAAQDIRRGRLEKVVLARTLRISYSRAVNVGAVLENLRVQNPDAAVFALRRDGATFLGATPEILARVQQDLVETMSLAGSAPRGLTPEEDRRLAEAMQHDPKIAREHAVVRRHVQEALSGLTDTLIMPDTPDLKKLPSVQHLLTPIHGHLKPGAGIWSVVNKLHPTPAVSGYPVEAATDYIVSGGEPFARGWYAGAIGWTRLSGDAQWMVALRSGLIHRNQVDLYAGCGIMGDSDPASELLESDWKFNTMLSALEIEGEPY